MLRIQQLTKQVKKKKKKKGIAFLEPTFQYKRIHDNKFTLRKDVECY